MKKNDSLSHLKFILLVSIILSLFVVMLGAFTRLTNAGLGCPDWPGCYGKIILPHSHAQLSTLQNNFPESPLETAKAWTEMIHRYAAGTLVLLIGLICYKAIKLKVAKKLPYILILLVLFQAALGMWTVTLKLLPIIVMAHLLGGMLIFTCLCNLYLQLTTWECYKLPQLRKWVFLGIGLVVLQIALGGWVTANYAGIACIGFPRCNGLWIPTLHLSKSFNLLAPVGTNYQGGLLDPETRMTIQFIHRIGAMVVTSYLLLFSFYIFKTHKEKNILRMAFLISIFILIQFSLGIINVVYLLPLPIAVMHNGMAAILLATVVCFYQFTREKKHVFSK